MKIHTLDLRFQDYERAIAAYLVEGPQGWVLVETGPMTTLNTLHQALQSYAPHLVDPGRLWHSAGRIYGDDLERLWGEILPAPAEHVVSLQDGDEVEVAGLTFRAVDTPGHAWHHHLYQIGNVGFAGDAAGVRMMPDEWLSLPAPPPEFDLDAWRKTLVRIQGLHLDAIYLTHFGKVENPDIHLQRFAGLLESGPAFIRRQMDAGAERDEVLQAYRTWNEARAVSADSSTGDFAGCYEAANPLFMSVDGIMRYWRKRDEKQNR
jgi:glyoxylase-like metal-dependent hydrolase (beta-lactamase superfamily II)